METFTLCLILALYAFALKLVGRKLGIIDPIILVVGGSLLALTDWIDSIHLDPKLAMVIFLPPVLYQAAISLSWREFTHNLRSILVLAVGLVLITATAVAAVGYWYIGLPLAAAFVLGAIVSPPDAVAATAVLGKLRVPKRIVTILEGESLINDATALVFYVFAVAAVVNGIFNPIEALGEFVWVSIAGIAIGLAIGKATILVHRRIEDPLLEILLSLTIPFVAYIGAEHVHASGVLAVVAAGLLRGAYSSRVLSATTRVQLLSMWQIIVFTLNAIGFLLIGIELRTVIMSLNASGAYTPGQLACYAAAICATVVLVRFAVIFPMAWIPRTLNKNFAERDPMPSIGTLTVMSWAGMRGIVSLVAALALPRAIDAPYGPFPGRDLILFLSYSVLLVTLIGQGSTLGWLARKLKVEVAACSPTMGRSARASLREAGLEALRRWSEGKSPTAVERLGQHYEQMLARLKAPESDNTLEELIAQDTRDYRELAKSALRAERLRLMEMRRKGEIEDDLALALQQELDLHEILIGTERGVG